MGCWNKTCGISQLPIMSGEKVVTFIIIQTAFSNRENMPSYANGAWNYIPIPIYGEYNDYGWMDVDSGQDDKLAFLKEYYKDLLVYNESQRERAKLCYPDLDGPFDNWESLGDSIHGNVWLIKNQFSHISEYANVNLMISSFMVDRRVYDAITDAYTVEYPTVQVFSRSDIAKSVDEFSEYSTSVEFIKSRIKKLGMEEKMNTLSAEQLNQLVLDCIGIFPDDAYREYIAEKFNDKIYDDPLAGVISFINASYGTESPAIRLNKIFAESILTSDDVASMYLFMCAMSVLRKSWYPQSGEGSQCGVEEQHGKLLKVMNEICKDYLQ